MWESSFVYALIVQQTDARERVGMRYIALGCFSFFLFATAARAEWLEVSSDHFLIYSDQSEKAVQRFAERLERFHSAMAYFYKKEQTKPSPSNRVTIFVVS